MKLKMEYNLLKTIEPSLQRIFTSSPSFSHMLTPFPAHDFVNPGLGNICRQYSFYMPIHTIHDVHTKSKQESQNEENLQLGSGESKNNETNEVINDTNDTMKSNLEELLKQSKPLVNSDNPVEYNERKRKQMGDEIHQSFLHPNFVKTSKIIIDSPKKRQYLQI
jgi:hypothetical protein